MKRKISLLLALAMLATVMTVLLPAHATSEHVHQWGTWVLVKAATCTEDGSEYRICSAPNCPQPDSREDKTIARLGHSYGVWNVTKPSTCTVQGEETRFCTRDGVSETRAIPVLGHEYGPWNVTTQPTCTEKGVETRYCMRGDDSQTREIAALTHDFTAWTVTKQPTCFEEGSRTRSCTRGDKVEVEPMAKLQHQWSEWANITAATCVKAGEQKRICSLCNTEEKRTVAALGPNQPNGHRFGEWTVSKPADCQVKGQEQRTCLDCARVETRETKLGKHVAKPGWFALPAPTLEKPGRKVQYCAVCDRIINSEEYTLEGYTYEMPALNFGPRVKSLFTGLEEHIDRFTPLDVSVDGETVYPLITEDGYYIADLKLTVLNDTLTVVYVMNDPESIVSNELLFLFDDPHAVTTADLNNVAGTLRFGEPIPLMGRTWLTLDVRMLVNYNKENKANRPFSDNGVYLDGVTQNAVLLQDMSVELIEGVMPV